MSDDAGPVPVARHGGAGEKFPPRTRVAIGFGSPAQDSGVTRLDLNDLLIQHPQATFVMRVAGAAMREVGIDDGDLVLVDRAIGAAHGHTVIAVVGDEFVCRRLWREGSELRLRASDPAQADIVAGEGVALDVWGVVTSVIKLLPV
jgi:DNA polymerase V